MPKPTVVLFATGGTIAMNTPSGPSAGGGGGGAMPALTGADLVKAVPALKRVADVEYEQVCNVPGPSIRFENLLDLLGRIRERFADANVSGGVVTHGTDTIEETAYFLDLVLGRGKPVVVTGAMRHAGLLSSDGPANLYQSVKVAASPEAVDRGALVVLNGTIHAAAEVTKLNTQSVETFHSPDFGPIGGVFEERVVFVRSPRRRRALPVTAITHKVAMVKMAVDPDPEFLEAIIGARPDGLVLEAVGGGHVPQTALPFIDQAMRQGTRVVMCTRVPVGPLLTETYGFAGSETDMRKRGIPFSHHNAQKTRIKLLVALEQKDPTAIEEVLADPDW